MPRFASFAAFAPLAQLLAIGLLAAAMPLGAHAAVKPQQLAPDFTLARAEGGNLRLAEQRGQVVLINFWASWCGPCRVEMPHLNRLHAAYGASGFTVLGINIDDNPAHGAATAARWGLKFPVLLDASKQVTRVYDLGAMPGTVLVDRDGRVRFLHRGYRDGMEAEYERQIRELVKE
jgi:peroxiredoxin